jgi:hypothetical protein
MQYRIFFQILLVSFLLIVKSAISQTVHSKDKWGDEVVFVDGAVLMTKDKWGQPLFYIDGQTLSVKVKWGEPVYYFESIPKKWVIICLIQ